jgi:hypothetical protein
MKKLLYTLVILAFVSSVNAQWVQMSNGMGNDTTVVAMASIGSNIFAGSGRTNNCTVYISTNNGVSWSQTGLVLPSGEEVNCLTTIGNTIIAGANDTYISTNNGSNWTSTLEWHALGLATLGASVFAGTDFHGVYRSDNNGQNWTYCGLNISSAYTFSKLGTNVFAGLENNGVYISSNNGANWTQAGLNNKTVHALTTLGTNIFAGTDTGIYISSNSGLNWSQTSMNTCYIFSLTVNGNNIFAGATLGGIYISSNNGINWIQKNEGLPANTNVLTLLIVNNYVFAGTFNKSIWRRPLSEMIGIKNISSEVPSEFSLSQNYPNPFNPTTKIKFDVVRVGDVKIVVYDAMGREVAVLVNESLNPGTYEATFDASQLTSGVYFYKITAGDFSETKKMILIK